MDKIEVNGLNEHPLFTWLKSNLPSPQDEGEAFMSDPKFIMWKPVKRSDVAWNFEKFLIGKDGRAHARFSKAFQTIDLKGEIEKLIKE